jgi:hypothetical protein
MAVVLRKSGRNEKYVKPSIVEVKALIRRGLILEYNKLHGYCDDAPKLGAGLFLFDKKLFKVEYFDGAIFPYLLKITEPIEVCEVSEELFPKRTFVDIDHTRKHFKAVNLKGRWETIRDYSNEPKIMTAKETIGYIK